MKLATLIRLGTQSSTSYFRDNCPQMAAAMAYHFFVALVPLVMFIVSVLGMIVGTEEVQQRIANTMSERLDLSTADVNLELTTDGAAALEAQHGSEAVVDVEAELAAMNASDTKEAERSEAATSLNDGETVTIAGYPLTEDDIDVHFDNLVLETVRGVVEASGTLSVVSFVVLGYAASGFFGNVRRALDFVWNQPRHLAMVPGKLFDLLALFLVVALAALSFVVLFALSVVATAVFTLIAEVRSEEAIWLERLSWGFVSFAVPLVISFVLFLLLYRYGPHAKNSLRNVWLGAILAAVGFEILKFGYSIYIANFSSFEPVYGALGGVLLFLLFVYLSAQVFLFGAEVGAEYPRVMRGEFIVDEPLPGPVPTTLRGKAFAAVRSLFVSRPPKVP